MSVDSVHPQPALTRWPVSFLRESRPPNNFCIRSPGMQELPVTDELRGNASNRSFSQQTDRCMFASVSSFSIPRTISIFFSSVGSMNANPGRVESRLRILG